MPDTAKARIAIRAAYGKRVLVNGGLSLAELKLQAAGGLLRAEHDLMAAPGMVPGEEFSLPWPEDDPVWIEHALGGLDQALKACDELREAIEQAVAETERLRMPRA